MKRLAGLFGVLAVAAAASFASAGEAMKPVAESGSVELFHCVKVSDRDHIAPCAEPLLVSIVDPCWKPDPCNPCCKPKCVNVLVCAPTRKCCEPCDPCCKDKGPKITCSKDGRKKRYDFGKYAIDIESKDGFVRVDYDD